MKTIKDTLAVVYNIQETSIGSDFEIKAVQAVTVGQKPNMYGIQVSFQDGNFSLVFNVYEENVYVEDLNGETLGTMSHDDFDSLPELF